MYSYVCFPLNIITIRFVIFVVVKLAGTESTNSSTEAALKCRLASGESSLTSRIKSGNTNAANTCTNSNGSAHSSVYASASASKRHAWNPWRGLLDTRWHISAYVCALRPWSLSTSLLPVALATIFAYKYNAQWNPLLTLIVAVTAISVHAAGLPCFSLH